MDYTPHFFTQTLHFLKKTAESFGESKKCITFAHDFGQGRSSAGLERFSHIEEVIGSSPIVPTTKIAKSRLSTLGDFSFPENSEKWD